MSNALNYIGLAKKAGVIEVGETNSGAAVRAGKGRVLLLASDASDNAKRRAQGFVNGTQTPLIVIPYTKADISQVTGMGGCSMAVFTDVGLAAVFMAALAEDEPSFKEIAVLLAQKNQKMHLRKKEALAHDRNMKKGRAAGSAATGKRRKNI